MADPHPDAWARSLSDAGRRTEEGTCALPDHVGGNDENEDGKDRGQQAGRAGRGAGKLHVPSLAVIVSFNSPSEQHLWSYPRKLLSRGLSFPISIPINASLVREHLLCAGAEYPLTGQFPVTILFETIRNKDSIIALSDYELFGSQAVFVEAIASLKSTGLMKEVSQQTASGNIVTFKTHPVS